MSDSTWVFGYGSLIWRPDFPFLDSRQAHITGWARRFWQGSHDHRGTPTDPGRVLTLVESPGEPCHGRAWLIEPTVFEHLDHREKNGYERRTVQLEMGKESQPGVVYIAGTNNHAFLGEASLSEIAGHIHRCTGPSGSNREYLLELAQELRNLGIADPHVFELERLVLELND